MTQSLWWALGSVGLFLSLLWASTHRTRLKGMVSHAAWAVAASLSLLLGAVPPSPAWARAAFANLDQATRRQVLDLFKTLRHATELTQWARPRLTPEEKRNLLTKLTQAEKLVRTMRSRRVFTRLDAWVLTSEIGLLMRSIKKIQPTQMVRSCYRPNMAAVHRTERKKSYARLMERKRLLSRAASKGTLSPSVHQLVEQLLERDISNLQEVTKPHPSKHGHHRFLDLQPKPVQNPVTREGKLAKTVRTLLNQLGRKGRHGRRHRR